MTKEMRTQSIVAVGVYDGMHRGHQRLLGQMVQEARSRGLRSVVVSFTRHPSCVMGRRSEELWLDEQQERKALIEQIGVDEVVMLDFSPEVAQLTACEFVEQRLVAQLGMKVLLLGYDTRFGNRAKDDFDQLPMLAQQCGFEIIKEAPLLEQEQPISSTRVRQALREGDVAMAAVLLGREYTLHGEVVKGRQMGRQLGFPTANVDLGACRKMVPADGVYVVWLKCEGVVWKGMANLGSQPTFEESARTLEVHLIHYDGNLYGRRVEVGFVKRLRGIVKFDSKEALMAQLNKDKAEIV